VDVGRARRSSLMAMSYSSWPEARRWARTLEGRIDTKLLQYLKLASSPDSCDRDIEREGSKLDSLERELEELLEQLGRVTDDMQNLAGDSATHGESETNKRYQGIFHQFSADFQRKKRSLELKSRRDRLLRSRHDGKDSNLTGIRPSETLRKEQEGLFSSIGLVDTLLRQSQATMMELKEQKGLFGRIGKGLGNLSKRFPQANVLLKKIIDKQNRDSIILAFVIASCMFFTFMYSYLSR